VNGDGTPYRSYLYAADLAIWLWTILVKGTVCYPYNVGSDRDITIADLAYTVSSMFNLSLDVLITQETIPGKPSERYVPSIQRARSELQLQPVIPLKESIRRIILKLNQKDTS
jgi:dTDP-glucose 4,6-dehydratase